MKKLLIVIAILSMACCVGAAEKRITITEGGTHIELAEKAKPITIQTKHNLLRVWPCGRVEKQIWKEINPNEDTAVWTGPSVSEALDDVIIYDATGDITMSPDQLDIIAEKYNN
jgi:hypothetical protein